MKLKYMIQELNFFMFLILTLAANSTNWDQKLKTDLFTNYKKFAFPSDSTVTHKTQIEFGSLIEVNTIKNQATLRIILREWWVDQRLTWNSSDYGNLSETIMPSDPQLEGVWITDLMIYESSEKPMTNLGNMRIRVSSNGEIYWSRLGLVTVNLEMNLHKYPFDEQTIQFTIESWRYTADRLQVSFHETPLFIEKTLFTPNVGWNVLGLSTKNITLTYSSGTFTTLYFWIKIKRAAETLVNTLIIPSIGIGFLGLFYYFMPRGNGERVKFLATLLLTEVMLLVILTQYLPASKSNPILENVLLVLTLMLKFILALAVILDYLERKFKKKTKKTLKFKFIEEISPSSKGSDRYLNNDKNEEILELHKINVDQNGENFNENKNENYGKNEFINANEKDSIKEIEKEGLKENNNENLDEIEYIEKNENAEENIRESGNISNLGENFVMNVNKDTSLNSNKSNQNKDNINLNSIKSEKHNENKVEKTKKKFFTENKLKSKKTKISKKDLIDKLDLMSYLLTIIIFLSLFMYYLVQWNK